MNRILVVTDFTRPSRVGVRYAARLAHLCQAKLHILHVFQATESDQSREEINEALDSLANEIQLTMPELEIDHTSRNSKEVIKSIASCSREFSASLIVLNTGDTGSDNWKIQSAEVSELARESERPVLSIPPDCIYRKINNVLYASDFKKLDYKKKFDLPVEIFKATGAHIEVLHLFKKDKLPDDEQLDHGAEIELIFKELSHQFIVRQSDDIVQGINEQIVKTPPQMLMVVARERSLIRSFFQKSISQDLALKTRIPLLVIPE